MQPFPQNRTKTKNLIRLILPKVPPKISTSMLSKYFRKLTKNLIVKLLHSQNSNSSREIEIEVEPRAAACILKQEHILKGTLLHVYLHEADIQALSTVTKQRRLIINKIPKGTKLSEISSKFSQFGNLTEQQMIYPKFSTKYEQVELNSGETKRNEVTEDDSCLSAIIIFQKPSDATQVLTRAVYLKSHQLQVLFDSRSYSHRSKSAPIQNSSESLSEINEKGSEKEQNFFKKYKADKIEGLIKEDRNMKVDSGSSDEFEYEIEGKLIVPKPDEYFSRRVTSAIFKKGQSEPNKDTVIKSVEEQFEEGNEELQSSSNSLDSSSLNEQHKAHLMGRIEPLTEITLNLKDSLKSGMVELNHSIYNLELCFETSRNRMVRLKKFFLFGR